MGANIPCVGCWWMEGNRCYQDKLIDVQGLDHMPRKVSGDAENGMEITDPLITACLAREVHERKSAVYGRLTSWLEKAGVEVVRVSISNPKETP